jgi:uncharacterized membrane protein YqiK
VDEHVFSAIVPNDEAEALLSIEEFDGTLGFTDDLRRHAAAATTAAATAETAAAATTKAAAATAATETVTAATAAAEAIAAAAEAVATATKAIAAAAEATAAEAAVFAKAVALVPATAALPAPSSIETHAVKIFPNSPVSSIHGRRAGTREPKGAAVMPSQGRLI